MALSLILKPDTPKSVTLCRATYKGSLSAVKYLSQREYESDTSFEKRNELVAVGYNYKKGIDTIVSMIFKEDIKYNEMPPNIEEMLETVDGNDDFTFFGRSILRSITVGHTGYVLVWTPQEKAANKQQEKELNIRPYAEFIERERVVEKYTQRDSKGALSQICIQGSYPVASTDDPYLMEDKPEYRFYKKDGTVDIFREAAEGGFTFFETRSNELKQMPVVEFLVDRDSDKTPPYYDSAVYQLHIMNIESGKDRYNFDLPFPTVTTFGMLQNSKNLVVPGLDGVQKVEFRSDKGIDFPVNPETGAKLGGVEFIERSGDIDGILAKSIEDKRASIDAAFIKLLVDSTGNKTVEQSESERAAGISSLTSISNAMAAGLLRVALLMMEMSGNKGKPGVILTKEFLSGEITPQQITLFYDLYLSGALTDAEYIKCLQDPKYFDSLDADKMSVQKRDEGL